MPIHVHELSMPAFAYIFFQALKLVFSSFYLFFPEPEMKIVCQLWIRIALVQVYLNTRPFTFIRNGS